MEIKYDPEADALYIRFREGPVTSKHVDDDITLNFSADNKIAGIEILSATERMGSKEFIKKLTMKGAHPAVTPDGRLLSLDSPGKEFKKPRPANLWVG